MKLFGGAGKKRNAEQPRYEYTERNAVETEPAEFDDVVSDPDADTESGFDYSAVAEAAAEELFWTDAREGEIEDFDDTVEVSQNEEESREEGFISLIRGLSLRRKVIISCLTVIALVSASAAAYVLWSSPPEVGNEGPTTPRVTAISSPGISAPPASEPEPTEVPDGIRKKGCYTFLIVGLDSVGNNTDTIIVGMLDAANHAVDFISIPRDTLINVRWGTKRINTVYPAAVNNGEDAVRNLTDGIRDLIGFEPDSYAIIDLTAFEKLIDAIGGVTYDVPLDMYYEAPDQDLHIAIPKGEHLLDGAEALKVVRYRSGYLDGDIGRINTQHDFMMTAAKQLLTLGNIPNLPTFIEIYQQYVVTDLSAGNLAFYAEEFLKISRENIRFHTLPGDYSGSVKGGAYVFTDLDEWIIMINKYINPWKVDITEANLNMLTKRNGSFYSTTGVIAGGEDSFVDYDAYIEALEREAAAGSEGAS